MTDVIKIIGIGLLALIIIVILKQYKPEFAIYVSMIAGVLILVLSIQKLTGIINLLQSLANKTYINKSFLSILLKITGIAFITEFAVSICSDAGEKAIASKIEIGSKVIIIAIITATIAPKYGIKLNNPIINPNSTEYLTPIIAIAIDVRIPTTMASSTCPPTKLKNTSFDL